MKVGSGRPIEKTKKYIKLNAAEIKSKHDRVKEAESLILQLPQEHNGRNSWLLNYGISKEAIELRKRRILCFMEDTQSCELTEHKI
jgi:hypothetical protein